MLLLRRGGASLWEGEAVLLPRRRWLGTRVFGRPMCSKAPGDADSSSPADAQPGSADEGTPAEPTASESKPQGYRVLWEAPTLTGEFVAAERRMTASAVVTGGGLGLALLGIAPHMAPNPFMVALLLSTVQVHVGHLWQTRILRSHLRRNVVELAMDGAVSDSSGEQLVIIRQDGHVLRDLRLKPRGDDDRPPSFAEVMKSTGAFLYLDRKAGKATDAEALETLLASECVIATEHRKIKPVGEEPQQEADKVVQGLAGLKREELARFEKAGFNNVRPKESIEQAVRSSQQLAAVVLLGGTVIFVGGRRDSG